jgi:hypothetical protein
MKGTGTGMIGVMDTPVGLTKPLSVPPIKRSGDGISEFVCKRFAEGAL